MPSVNIQACLFVVDDDFVVRQSIEILAKSVGIPCRSFASAESLLTAYEDTWQGCLLIDFCLGGMNGLQLQEELSARGCRMPVIMVSAYVDVRSAVRAMA